MPNFVLVVDGVVVQKQPYLQDGFVEAPDNVVPGFVWGGNEFLPPDPTPAPVPESITMRQLLIGLMGAEWITPAEADAWSADGTLPATIVAVIDDLPTETEQVAARITARKMSQAYRNDPLLIAAAHAAMPDASEQEISDTLDNAFREWSQI